MRVRAAVRRRLGRIRFLWCSPTSVSQQAVSQRFLTFPAELFERVFKQLLPELRKAWHSRNNRPMPASLQFTLSKFERILIADGSTLEALFRKLKSLQDIPPGQLAGKMGIVIDLMTRLPVEIWFQEEVRSGKTWHSYLTSVLDPNILPPYVVADLYRRRWRIEDAFNIVKRLLGLGYLWTGSLNGIQLQIWGTWLFYAVLVDLGDAVADELSLPNEPHFSRDDLSGTLSFFGSSSKGSG